MSRTPADPSPDEFAVDGPLDPRRRRAARLGGCAALAAAERDVGALDRDRRAGALVGAVAAARTAGGGAALGRAVRRLHALRRTMATHALPTPDDVLEAADDGFAVGLCGEMPRSAAGRAAPSALPALKGLC